MTTRVVMYSRPSCHLCDDARAVVKAVCESADVEWSEHNIDEDPALLAQYSDEVPVVTVDGEVVAFWRVSPELLRSALQ